MWPSDCSQVRWSLRSTQAVAAAGQEPRVLELGVEIRVAAASGVGRESGEGTPIAARTFACSARVGCVTWDTAFPGWWPPCQPAAVVPATIMKAKTAVSR